MKKIIAVALVFSPVFAFAPLGNVEGILESIGNLVELALPIVVGLGLLAFFWGLVKFIFASGDETAKDQGKRIMLWGVIALFVMVAVWGLVEFIGDSLDIDTDADITVPTVPGI